MNNEKLVELITKEVIRRMKAIIEENNSIKNKILILEHNENMCPIVKKRLEENNIIADSIDTMKDINEYKCILIQNISNNELRNISQGYGSSQKEKLIVDLILKGEKLYALEKGVEFEEYKDVAPKVLINVFEEYKNKLELFGVVFTSLKSIISNTNKVEKAIKEVVKKEENIGNNMESIVNEKCCIGNERVLNKKLISEMDIRNLKKEGVNEIIVAKKSIITPLAKDFARINNLVIKVES